MTLNRLFIALAATLLLAGCQSEMPPEEVGNKLPFTACPDERPTACTMDYRPVCAERDTGIRCVTTPCPSSEWRTYSNGCSACGDANVLGHVEGPCEAAAPEAPKAPK